MAITNHERVGKALELLKDGLAPFIDRELKNVYKEKAAAEAAGYLGEDCLLAKKALAEWDAAALSSASGTRTPSSSLGIFPATATAALLAQALTRRGAAETCVCPQQPVRGPSGRPQGPHSIRINEQWRICFTWRNGHAYDVEIVDYH